MTPSFYIDAPLIRGFKKTHWIGVGGVLYNDQAGSSELSNGGFLGSIAYHITMGARNTKSYLTFAVQLGMIQRRITMDNLLFGDALQADLDNNQTGSPSQDNTVGDSKNSFDVSAGMLLRSNLSKQTRLNLGFAVKHITTPNYNLLQGNENRIDQFPDSIQINYPLMFTFHGGFHFDLNKQWTLSPTFMYNQVSNDNEIALQSWLDYKVNPEKDTKLRFGVGYRLSSDIQALFGVDVKDFRFALAYDVNIFNANEITNTVGGLELAASYIIKIFKDPAIKPVIICPRL